MFSVYFHPCTILLVPSAWQQRANLIYRSSFNSVTTEIFIFVAFLYVLRNWIISMELVFHVFFLLIQNLHLLFIYHHSTWMWMFVYFRSIVWPNTKVPVYIYHSSLGPSISLHCFLDTLILLSVLDIIFVRHYLFLCFKNVYIIYISHMWDHLVFAFLLLLLWLSSTSSCSIYVVQRQLSSVPLCSICSTHNFFIHSSIIGCLGCFQFLGIIILLWYLYLFMYFFKLEF